MRRCWVTLATILCTLAYARGDCPSDINNSGTTDVDDLLALIGAWGNCPAPPCSEDIDGDGDIDVDDMLILLGAFGPCDPESIHGCGGTAGTWARGGAGRPVFDAIPNGFRNTTAIVEDTFASTQLGDCVLPEGGDGPTIVTYPIEGGDLVEVSEAIFDPVTGAGFPDGDTRFAGLTRFHYTYMGRVTNIVKGKAFYQITQIRFSLTIEVPAWNPPDDAPDAHVAEWERFSEKLMIHEIGHADLYEAQFGNIKNRFENQPAGLISVQGITEPLFDDENNPNHAMWDLINQAAKDAIQANPNFTAMDEANEAYDAPPSKQNPDGTDHGRTQGAVLITNP